VKKLGAKKLYKKQDMFCRKKEKVLGGKIKDFCPSVCNLRCSCKNSKIAFTLKDVGKKSEYFCSDFKGKRHCDEPIKNRKKFMKDFCPRKCGDCYD